MAYSGLLRLFGLCRSMEGDHSMDSEARKRVLRKLTYGLYILTTERDGRIQAGTINFLMQTSFDPPLVAAGLKVGSGIAEGAAASRRFAVNIAGKGQHDLAARFFKPSREEDGKLNGFAYRKGENGCAILEDTVGAFECGVEEIVRRGDHHIYVARVTQVHEQSPEAALSMADTSWSYGG
ncbi:MAG: hypothetical protein GF355_02910 [Candidatus Eisenbacteria bacterium]|nr:hypothetical protein [Candidatus Eisenbacteria bacterium]